MTSEQHAVPCAVLLLPGRPGTVWTVGSGAQYQPTVTAAAAPLLPPPLSNLSPPCPAWSLLQPCSG